MVSRCEFRTNLIVAAEAHVGGDPELAMAVLEVAVERLPVREVAARWEISHVTLWRKVRTFRALMRRLIERHGPGAFVTRSEHPE